MHIRTYRRWHQFKPINKTLDEKINFLKDSNEKLQAENDRVKNLLNKLQNSRYRKEGKGMDNILIIVYT